MWNKIKSLLKMEPKEYVCSIYKTDIEYKIVTESKTNTGLFIADKPIYIISVSVSDKELSDKIFSSLHSSKQNAKFPETKEEMTKFQKEHLENLKEKSFINLYKKSTYCSIRLIGDTITIIPSRLNKTWLEPIEEKSLTLKYNNELEITKIILDVLEKRYVE